MDSFANTIVRPMCTVTPSGRPSTRARYRSSVSRAAATATCMSVTSMPRVRAAGFPSWTNGRLMISTSISRPRRFRARRNTFGTSSPRWTAASRAIAPARSSGSPTSSKDRPARLSAEGAPARRAKAGFARMSCASRLITMGRGESSNRRRYRSSLSRSARFASTSSVTSCAMASDAGFPLNTQGVDSTRAQTRLPSPRCAWYTRGGWASPASERLVRSRARSRIPGSVIASAGSLPTAWSSDQPRVRRARALAYTRPPACMTMTLRGEASRTRAKSASTNTIGGRAPGLDTIRLSETWTGPRSTGPHRAGDRWACSKPPCRGSRPPPRFPRPRGWPSSRPSRRR